MRFILFACILSVGVAARGQQLFRQNSGTSEPLYTISMMDDSNGIAAGFREVLTTTTNGGVRWNAKQLLGPEAYYCSYFNDTASGAIGGWDGTLLIKRPGQGLLSTTTLPERRTIHGVTFPTSDSIGNPMNILCVGDSGLIYFTGNGGKNWKKIAVPAVATTNNLSAVTYWDDSTWWTVGQTGLILYTEDAGTTWQRIPSGTQKDLYSIAFPSDGTTGWIAGDQTLLYTTDGGDTWQSIPDTNELYCVDGYDSTGFAVGQNGTLLGTTDLIHWSPIETGTTADLYGISITDNLYIVGDSGIILSSMVSRNNAVRSSAQSDRNFTVTSNGRELSLAAPLTKSIDIHIFDLLGLEREQVHITGQSATLNRPLPNGIYLYRTSLGMTGKFIVR